MLNELRQKNIDRQAAWPGAQTIDIAFRGLELAGETGELCNKLKKLTRIHQGIAGTNPSERAALMQDIREELADVVICVDLIAMDLDINLADAVPEKFNATSDKVGLDVKFET